MPLDLRAMSEEGKELTLAGTVLYGEDFEVIEGYVVVDVRRGVIKEVSRGEEVDAAVHGVLLPAFVNAHTHVGDAVAKEPPDLPLEALVGPGGLKERILRETPPEKLIEAMQDAIFEMLAAGTLSFADFREGGIEGVRLLKKALTAAERIAVGERGRTGKTKKLDDMAYILGRPTSAAVEDAVREAAAILEEADGIGMSSVADHPLGLLEELAATARKRRRLFALHAGERDERDVATAIELRPDFLVHLTHASPSHFKKMQDVGVGAVVCVRSNLRTGVGLPPLKKMLEIGLTIGVGTDNVMLNAPNMFSELEFISKIYRLDARTVLRMGTLYGARVLKKGGGTLAEGQPARILVLKKDSPNLKHVRDVLKAIVNRASVKDVAAVVAGGFCMRGGG